MNPSESWQDSLRGRTAHRKVVTQTRQHKYRTHTQIYIHAPSGIRTHDFLSTVAVQKYISSNKLQILLFLKSSRYYYNDIISLLWFQILPSPFGNCWSPSSCSVYQRHCIVCSSCKNYPSVDVNQLLMFLQRR
jgi:hypothetical protein